MLKIVSEKKIVDMIIDEFIVADPEDDEQFIANDVAMRILKRVRECAVEISEKSF